MGLAERRAIKHFEEQNFPVLKTQIDKAAGFDVPMEVSWDTLTIEGWTKYDECLPQIFFQPLAEALQAITVDDMGKEALRGGLKQIVIRNTGQFFNTNGFSFQDGVLVLDHQANANVSDVEERKNGIQDLLEKAL